MNRRPPVADSEEKTPTESTIDAPQKNYRTLIDYVRFYPLLIAILIFEVIIFAVLFPTFHFKRLQMLSERAIRAKEQTKVYQYEKSLAVWHGREPNDNDGFMKKLFNGYWRRSPEALHAYYFWGGKAKYELRDYKEAYELFDKLEYQYFPYVPIEKVHAYRDAAWGVVLFNQGQQDKAVEKFMQSLKASPNEPVANFYLGKFLYDKGSFIEASLYLKHCLTNSPNQDEAQKMMKDIEKRVLGSIPETSTLSNAGTKNGAKDSSDSAGRSVAPVDTSATASKP